GIVELRDNGPFFDVPATLSDRNLIIRAAKGYRPLLVWDVERTLDERRRYQDRRKPMETDSLVFLEIKHGSPTLQDIHLALRWPEAPPEGVSVLRVEDGDLTVTDCTFSVVGKPRDGVTLARVTATDGTPVPPAAPMGETDERPVADKGGSRCRFTRC